MSSYTQFKALKIPEPVDTQTSAISAQEVEAVSDYVKQIPFFLLPEFHLKLAVNNCEYC